MRRNLRALFGGLLVLAACGSGGQPAASTSEPTTAPNGPSSATQKNLGQATDIQLLDANGAATQLASAWADSAAVVIFYRGHW